MRVARDEMAGFVEKPLSEQEEAARQTNLRKQAEAAQEAAKKAQEQRDALDSKPGVKPEGATKPTSNLLPTEFAFTEGEEEALRSAIPALHSAKDRIWGP